MKTGLMTAEELSQRMAAQTLTPELALEWSIENWTRAGLQENWDELCNHGLQGRLTCGLCQLHFARNSCGHCALAGGLSAKPWAQGCSRDGKPSPYGRAQTALEDQDREAFMEARNELLQVMEDELAHVHRAAMA